MEKIIANVESGIRNFPIEVAENIRTETSRSRILQRSKPPKQNLTTDSNIAMLAAEKANARCYSLNAKRGLGKIREILNPSTYNKL